MATRTTVLRSTRHSDFLGAQHRDPVTGKTFTAGDKLTLCAACLSPFLEESWRGIGGTHCGQSSTTGFQEQPSDGHEQPRIDPKVDPNGNGANPTYRMKNGKDGLRPIPIELEPIPIGLN